MYTKRIRIIFILLIGLGNAVIGQAADVFNGKEVYTKECMSCHGEDGTGKMPGLPNFKEGQALYNTDDRLMQIIRDGKGVMPSFGGLLTDDEISDVTAYLRTFM